LIVEELPNLELRKRRAKMFEAGMTRLYQTIVTVFNTFVPGMFPPNSVVDVNFFDPILPTDSKEQELMWSMRIAEGRATRTDYFMATQGMTKDEAELKVKEIDADKVVSPPPVTATKKFSVSV
jgi:hypothetical protein